jgi:hypothetical protein
MAQPRLAWDPSSTPAPHGTAFCAREGSQRGSRPPVHMESGLHDLDPRSINLRSAVHGASIGSKSAFRGASCRVRSRSVKASTGSPARREDRDRVRSSKGSSRVMGGSRSGSPDDQARPSRPPCRALETTMPPQPVPEPAIETTPPDPRALQACPWIRSGALRAHRAAAPVRCRRFSRISPPSGVLRTATRGDGYSEAPAEIQSAMRFRSSGQKANEELRGIGPLPGVGGALRSALYRVVCWGDALPPCGTIVLVIEDQHDA